MQIKVTGTPGELKEYFRNENKTPMKSNFAISGEGILLTSDKKESRTLKATNLNELESIKSQLLELYQLFIDFQVETEIREDKRA